MAVTTRGSKSTQTRRQPPSMSFDLSNPTVHREIKSRGCETTRVERLCQGCPEDSPVSAGGKWAISWTIFWGFRSTLRAPLGNPLFWAIPSNDGIRRSNNRSTFNRETLGHGRYLNPQSTKGMFILPGGTGAPSNIREKYAEEQKGGQSEPFRRPNRRQFGTGIVRKPCQGLSPRARREPVLASAVDKRCWGVW